VPRNGLVLLNGDDANCLSLKSYAPVRTVGLGEGCSERLRLTGGDGDGTDFEINGVAFRVPMIGEFNVRNAAMAVCAARHAGLSDAEIRAALATGQQNHQLNGITHGAKFLGHDLFSSWGKVSRMGPYDLVIADPPSFQKGSFVATKDWPRLLRRLPDLLSPNGRALLCLNAPEIPESFLHEGLASEAPELVFEQRLPNPTVFADISPDRALKVLVVRAPPLPNGAIVTAT
jgi:hypothetical protein